MIREVNVMESQGRTLRKKYQEDPGNDIQNRSGKKIGK
jgi:hypothetical protein